MDAAVQMIARAVELDQLEKYREALVCYQEGLDLLLKCSKGVMDKDHRDAVRTKIKTYMDRAEVVKGLAEKQREAGDYHEKIEIASGQKGFSYAKVFSKLIDDNLTEVVISDAYIRNPHQIYNLVRFCELMTKEAKNIKQIRLITGLDVSSDVQGKGLKELQMSLSNYDIDFSYEYSDTLHDREIAFNNGWIIKIGRGFGLL